MELGITPKGRRAWRRKTYPATLATGSTLRWLEKDFICGICERRHDDGNLSRSENQAGFCDDDKPWAAVALQPEHYTTDSPARVTLYAKIKRIRETLGRGANSIVEGPAMPFWALALKFAERFPDSDPLASGAAQTSEVKHLLLFFEARPIGEIGAAAADEFAAKFVKSVGRRGPRTPASARPVLDVLRRMLGFAWERGWIKEKPLPLGVALGPAPPMYASDRIMTAEEERRLHAACVGRFSYLLPALVFVADAPAHQREFLRLRWANVDLGGGLVNIEASNTRRLAARRVQMTPRLRTALATLRGRAKPSDDSPLVPYSVDRFNYDFEKVCDAAGVEGLNWSDIRRTGAWRLERAGKDTRQIAAALGMTHLDNVAALLRVNPETAASEAVLPLFRKLLEEQFGVAAQPQNVNGQKTRQEKMRERRAAVANDLLNRITKEVLRRKKEGAAIEDVTADEVARELSIGGTTGGNVMIQKLKRNDYPTNWPPLRRAIWDGGESWRLHEKEGRKLLRKGSCVLGSMAAI